MDDVGVGWVRILKFDGLPALYGFVGFLEQKLMVAGLNPQDEPIVEELEQIDMGSIRAKCIFGDYDLEMRVFGLELHQESFGGVAFTIVFGGSVLSANEFRRQGEDFLEVGMNEGAPHGLEIIGGLARF